MRHTPIGDKGPPYKATIKEVAKRAGVSVATISRTLNNIGVVRKETRQKVMRAVEEMRYSPNLHAASLAKGHSNMIGLVVPDIANPFFNELAKAVGDAARTRNIHLLLTNTAYDPDVALECIQDLMESRVAGIVLFTSVLDLSIIDEIARQQIPVCLLDLNIVRDYVSNISINFRNPTLQVIEHLVSLGHRRIALGSIRGPLKMTPERHKVFETCCAMYTSYIDKFWIVTGDYSVDGGKKVVEELFDSGDDLPTAIWFRGDIMAFGAMKELRRRNLSVPGDVSVIGMGDTFFSTCTDPELTTVAIDHNLIGHTAVAAIDHILQARVKAGLDYPVNPQLVVRGTTGPVPLPKNRPH